MSKQTAKWLRQVAEEIRKENHAGWGNTCEMAADEVDAMQARIDALTKALEREARYHAGGENNYRAVRIRKLLEAEK